MEQPVKQEAVRELSNDPVLRSRLNNVTLHDLFLVSLADLEKEGKIQITSRKTASGQYKVFVSRSKPDEDKPALFVSNGTKTNS